MTIFLIFMTIIFILLFIIISQQMRFLRHNINLLPNYTSPLEISNSNFNFLDAFPTYIQKLLKEQKDKYFVILSSKSCEYCESNIKEFMESYLENEKYPFVILEHDYYLDEIEVRNEKSNLKIHVNNLFMDNFFIKTFPTFIVLNSEHQIEDVARVTPIKIINNYLKGGEV